MAKKKSKKSAAPLDKLIQAADATVLGQLIGQLAASSPAVRRQCLEFLQQHVTLTAATKADADVETVFSLWEELEPDLTDLNEYGGGPDGASVPGAFVLKTNECVSSIRRASHQPHEPAATE